ncbi:tape measure protein [Salmonella enterica]|nr:tape measure protein [Salmonella enterica]
MATLRELIIKISANSQSFQTEIARASRTGQDYYRTMQNGGRQAAAASRETQRALAEVTNQLNSAKASAMGLAGAFAGAYATGHLISLADEWSSVNARLKQASQSTDDFKESQRALMDISQRTGTAFSDNASLFARSAASMREYGYSSEEVLKVTEAISTGLKLSGASTSEASSVITQFSQALAQGVLRGEEFNSVNENGDRVIRALASGMGVARKDLKAMADQGQLTSDKVVPALISQLGSLREEYNAMPQTVAAATTKIENAFMAWVGGANEATGATSALTGVLNTISDNINTVAAAAGALAAIGGARFLGGMFGDLSGQTAQLIDARKNEIALAVARASSATQSQRKAAADAIAAERAYQLSQMELELTRNTNAEATATQNVIAKRRAMITANAALVQSNRAVTASQQALNSATSVILNAMLVDSLRSASNSGFFSSIGGMFGAGAGAASGSTPSGAYNSAASGIKLNAKGGAYASESLSAYSNRIVSTPTYFAFAKGAGLMGEAGPEAIMPLTRSADGSLGVRMVGTPGATSGGGDTIIHQHFNISGNGDAALKQAMQEAARQGANDGAKQARQDLLQDFSNRGQARRLLGV